MYHPKRVMIPEFSPAYQTSNIKLRRLTEKYNINKA
jgi:hypothetical protein